MLVGSHSLDTPVKPQAAHTCVMNSPCHMCGSHVTLRDCRARGVQKLVKKRGRTQMDPALQRTQRHQRIKLRPQMMIRLDSGDIRFHEDCGLLGLEATSCRAMGLPDSEGAACLGLADCELVDGAG